MTDLTIKCKVIRNTKNVVCFCVCDHGWMITIIKQP